MSIQIAQGTESSIMAFTFWSYIGGSITIHSFFLANDILELQK